jgi:putative hydrolase of the HAD superfamily
MRLAATACAAPDVPAPRYDAVTFDYWQTICIPDADRGRARRVESTRKVLAAEGVTVTDEEIDAAIVVVLQRFDETWRANQQFTAVDAVEVFAAEVAPTLSAAARAALVEGFASTGDHPPLTPNIASTLQALKASGLRLGIICDVGMQPSTRLREILEHHQLLELFDHWSFSDEVGVYKPSPEIFVHALDGLGVDDPARAAHVGDLRRTDIAGALAIGMTAVRYRGCYDDGDSPVDDGEDHPEGDHVIDDHAELPPLLGVA